MFKPVPQIYWVRISEVFGPRALHCKQIPQMIFYALNFEKVYIYSGFLIKSLDKIECLTSKWFTTEFPSLVAGFPGSGNYNQSSHVLTPFKRKKKCTADFSVNIQNRAFLQLAKSPKCTHGTRKGVTQTQGHGNISKGNEVRKRM